MSISVPRSNSQAEPKSVAEPAVIWAGAFFLVCAWWLLAHLGAAVLFEPDEGRNAEIAREILLLKDWITPHYDFVPRLDKPIFFFDLVALFYRFFGISEWSARLPAAAAALGCVFVTYRLSRSLHGRAAAMWSALVLASSIEFFALSQVVLLDMLLTFFITLGLAMFFWGERRVEQGAGRTQFLCMYAAFGAATLTKGPLGFGLPSMIIFLYVLANRRWSLLRKIEPALGVPLFLLIAAPWYLIAELRNPGYLRHFLLQEHLVRFATTKFNRSQPWYFYFLILPAGFFPWTVFLPRAAVGFWRQPRRRDRLFFALWAVTPLLLFSLSSSKMIHYILPIFPALAIMVGATIADGLGDEERKSRRRALFPGVAFLALAAALALAFVWPALLPADFRIQAAAASRHVSAAAMTALFMLAILTLVTLRSRLWREPAGIYLFTVFGFTLFITVSPAITNAIAEQRSSRSLAQQAAPHIGATDGLVIYGGYPSSLPFYLNIDQPIRVVWSEAKRQVLGSDYVALKRPAPAPGYSQVLYSPAQFAELWSSSGQRLLAFVDVGSLMKFKRLTKTPLYVLLQVGSTAVIANRPVERPPAIDDDPGEGFSPMVSERKSVKERSSSILAGRASAGWEQGSSTAVRSRGGAVQRN